MDDFVEGTLHYFDKDENKDGVITIGDTTSQPVGVGTVKIQIRDNESNLVDVELERVLYFPHSPVNVISVTYLAHQFSDEDGTWIKTKMQTSTFTWDHE